MSSRPSLTVYKAIEEARQEQLAALADLEGVVLTNVFQPMSSLAMKQSANSPLGLDPVGQQCTYIYPNSPFLLSRFRLDGLVFLTNDFLQGSSQQAITKTPVTSRASEKP